MLQLLEVFLLNTEAFSDPKTLIHKVELTSSATQKTAFIYHFSPLNLLLVLI